MKERIQQFLAVENKTSAQFAETIGVQPSSVSHILSGRNNPSLDFILKMLAKFPELSTDWLLFGKGAMYKSSKSAALFDDLVESEDDTPYSHASLAVSGIEPEKSGTPLDSPKLEKREENRSLSLTDKIVIFYNDGSFSEYHPKE